MTAFSIAKNHVTYLISPQTTDSNAIIGRSFAGLSGRCSLPMVVGDKTTDSEIMKSCFELRQTIEKKRSPKNF